MKKIMIIAGLLALGFLVSCGQQPVDIVAESSVNQPVVQVAEIEEAIQTELVSEGSDEAIVEESEEEVESEEVNIEPEIAVEETEVVVPVALAGSYQDYDSSLLGATENTILFFHASWCPPCRAADAAISESGVSDNLSILKVNFDDSAELRQKYGVTTQHTFVQVDAEGNMIHKWSGGTTVADLEANLQ